MHQSKTIPVRLRWRFPGEMQIDCPVNGSAINFKVHQLWALSKVYCSGYITGKPGQKPTACVACRCSQGINPFPSSFYNIACGSYDWISKITTHITSCRKILCSTPFNVPNPEFIGLYLLENCWSGWNFLSSYIKTERKMKRNEFQ